MKLDVVCVNRCPLLGIHTEPDTRANSSEGRCKKSKNNSLHAYFALVFLQHTSFSFRGGMERGEEGGMECVALTVFIARCSDQNYQCTTK